MASCSAGVMFATRFCASMRLMGLCTLRFTVIGACTVVPPAGAAWLVAPLAGPLLLGVAPSGRTLMAPLASGMIGFLVVPGLPPRAPPPRLPTLERPPPLAVAVLVWVTVCVGAWVV